MAAPKGKEKMVKIKRLGETAYHGSDPSSSDGSLRIDAGATGETGESNAARLLEDYPGEFELVDEKAAPAAPAPTGAEK